MIIRGRPGASLPSLLEKGKKIQDTAAAQAIKKQEGWPPKKKKITRYVVGPESPLENGD